MSEIIHFYTAVKNINQIVFCMDYTRLGMLRIQTTYNLAASKFTLCAILFYMSKCTQFYLRRFMKVLSDNVHTNGETIQFLMYPLLLPHPPPHEGGGVSEKVHESTFR